MKRLLAWIFVLPLALGLAACGNDADKSAQSTNQQAAASGKTQNDEAAANNPSDNANATKPGELTRGQLTKDKPKSLTQGNSGTHSGSQPKKLSKQGLAKPGQWRDFNPPLRIQSKQDWDKLGLPPASWGPVQQELASRRPNCPFLVDRIWGNTVVSMTPGGLEPDCDNVGMINLFENLDGNWIFYWSSNPPTCEQVRAYGTPPDIPHGTLLYICFPNPQGEEYIPYKDYLKRIGQ